jgi:hypothetical protein
MLCLVVTPLTQCEEPGFMKCSRTQRRVLRDRQGLSEAQPPLGQVPTDAPEREPPRSRAGARARSLPSRSAGPASPECCRARLRVRPPRESDPALAFPDMPARRVEGKSVRRAKIAAASERLRDRVSDKSGVTQRGEPDPEDTSVEPGDQCRSGFDRQPLRARSSAQRTAGRVGRVRVRDRLQRRERAIAKLEDRERLSDVLEAVLAQIAQT